MTETVDIFPNLRGHAFASLTTFRKTGVAVPTPIWFAPYNSKLYVVTDGTSGKVKRIRNNAHVTLAPCTGNGKVLGPALDGRARVMSFEEGSMGKVALDRKYGVQMAAATIVWWLSGKRDNTVFLEIEPA